MPNLKLKKPVKINGAETDTIEYDLESLTGANIQIATKELQSKGIIVGVTELDTNYQAAIFAQASGLSFEDLKLLGAKDYNKMLTVVRDFFLETSEEK